MRGNRRERNDYLCPRPPAGLPPCRVAALLRSEEEVDEEERS